MKKKISLIEMLIEISWKKLASVLLLLLLPDPFLPLHMVVVVPETFPSLSTFHKGWFGSSSAKRVGIWRELNYFLMCLQ